MKFQLITILTFVAQTVFCQQVIDLYPEGIPNLKDTTGYAEKVFYFDQGTEKVSFITQIIKPTLTIFLPTKKTTRQAVVICPGGGYSGLAMDHEGYWIAKKFAENGIAAFVLKYRMPNNNTLQDKEKAPLQDAQRAIQIVRQNAKKWKIDVNKVGILGSSAGGHLASTAATHFNQVLVPNASPMSVRPDFTILNYPVISFADSLTHYGSRMNLIGSLSQKEIDKISEDWSSSEEKLKKIKIDKNKIEEYSNELRVNKNTPPAFITHAYDDDVVKVGNSILYIAALQKYKVGVASFFYAHGGHGYGMDNPSSDTDWIEACIQWMKTLK